MFSNDEIEYLSTTEEDTALSFFPEIRNPLHPIVTLQQQWQSSKAWEIWLGKGVCFIFCTFSLLICKCKMHFGSPIRPFVHILVLFQTSNSYESNLEGRFPRIGSLFLFWNIFSLSFTSSTGPVLPLRCSRMFISYLKFPVSYLPLICENVSSVAIFESKSPRQFLRALLFLGSRKRIKNWNQPSEIPRLLRITACSSHCCWNVLTCQTQPFQTHSLNWFNFRMQFYTFFVITLCLQYLRPLGHELNL